jgi:hypothetical protein
VLVLPVNAYVQRFLPTESALKNHAVRRPDGEFGLQRIVPGLAERIARNRDKTELRERPQRFGQALYILASDGKLHAFNLVSGEDVFAPTPFVPAFAKMWSMNAVNGLLYTTISQNCNGVKSGVYAMDLSSADRKVSYFEASSYNGAGIWGRAGAAITSDGRVIIETGDGTFDPEKRQWRIR